MTVVSMPVSFHEYEEISEADLSALNRRARLSDLTSRECLDLLIEMHRRGNHNDLSSLLRYLAELR